MLGVITITEAEKQLQWSQKMLYGRHYQKVDQFNADIPTPAEWTGSLRRSSE